MVKHIYMQILLMVNQCQCHIEILFYLSLKNYYFSNYIFIIRMAGIVITMSLLSKLKLKSRSSEWFECVACHFLHYSFCHLKVSMINTQCLFTKSGVTALALSSSTLY